MLLAGLHAASRDGPCCIQQGNLGPRSAQRLSGSCRAEDSELQRSCGDVAALTQLAHEWWHINIGHRFVMVDLRYFADGGKHLLQVPPPARWIITGPKAAHRRPRQHALDPTTSA